MVTLTERLIKRLKDFSPAGECTACAESYFFTRLFTAGPCGHKYCLSCLATMFQLSLTDTSTYPARCCDGPIDYERCWRRSRKRHRNRYLGGQALLQDLRDKKEELATRASDRFYCPSCSAYIPRFRMDTVRRSGWCRGCDGKFCLVCRGAQHRGRWECPGGKDKNADDDNLAKLKHMATKCGWQQCPGCEMFVERSRGCNRLSKYCTPTLPTPITDCDLPFVKMLTLHVPRVPMWDLLLLYMRNPQGCGTVFERVR